MKRNYNLAILVLLLSATNANTQANASNKDIPYFELATKSAHFVDKTMLIKYFLDHQPVIFTRPRDFGKTTNLDMVRRFFEVPYDPTTGRRIDKRTTHYYRLFTNKSLNLRIAEDKIFLEKHFGEYPLLYFDFTNINGTTVEHVIKLTVVRISTVLETYRWLYDQLRQNNEEDPYWLDWTFQCLNEIIVKKKANKYNIAPALRGMLELLERYFGQKVIVLIDNYDSPLMNGINIGSEVREIALFTDSFWEELIKYKPVKFIVMATGVIRDMEQSEIFKKFNENYFLMDVNDTDEYFGFTENEVQFLLAAKNITVDERNKVKEYFNGYEYQLGYNQSTTIYNPKGVINYLKTNTFDHAPATDEMVTKLMRCLRHKEFFHHIKSLIRKKPIRHQDYPYQISPAQTFTDLVRDDCYLLRRFMPYTKILLDDGYLTFHEESTPSKQVRVSNKMMQNRLKQDFRNFYRTYYEINISNSDINTTLRSILYSNTTTDEMLHSLAESFQLLIQPVQNRYKFADFQLALIIHATVIFNLDFYEDVGMAEKYFSSTRNVDCYDNHFNTLRIPSPDGRIFSLIDIIVEKEPTEGIDRIKNFLPASPRNKSNPITVKYFAINANKDGKVQVVAGPNRIHC